MRTRKYDSAQKRSESHPEIKVGKVNVDEEEELAGRFGVFSIPTLVVLKDGKIADDKRIVGALPTIKYLLKEGAAVILCSHFGRPHNIFNAKLELDKKEKKKVEALPEEERRFSFKRPQDPLFVPW